MSAEQAGQVAEKQWRFQTLPLDARRLRAFSELVADPNPVHVDPEFARALGLPGAIAQGGLVVSALSRMLEREQITHLDVQLLASVPAGTAIVCEGEAVRVTADGHTEVNCVVHDRQHTVFARAVAMVSGQHTD
jgi:acyl dehydratase